ncbi:MAG: NrfD/PsrC family molybdoenzyme membrane anchor subunit [Candidatus Kapaibacteriales bacterium]
MKRVNTNRFYVKVILFFSIFFCLIGLLGIVVTLFYGLQTWGINAKVVWGLGIVNFIFWIGNAHSGTLISAVLFLLRQHWNKYIHRLAETITIISIVIAMIFPLIHLGRPWFFYWLFPIPTQMGIWSNFKSPLVWDVYAIIIYAVLSFIFWVIGFIPEVKNFRIYNFKSIKKLHCKIWTGSENDWKIYWKTYRLLAGILTFVVISVHSIVSFDFATTISPIWHTTIQPVFFIVGAIYSGLALVLTLSIFFDSINQKKLKIPEFVFDKLAKMLLTFSLLILYFYFIEHFFVYYSQNFLEFYVYQLRFKGLFFIITLIVLFCNIIFPQLLWLSNIRKNKNILIVISLLILVGMWLERFLIVIPTLSFEFSTRDIVYYFPTWIEISLTLGSIGFFNLSFYFVSKLIEMFPDTNNLNQ